MAVVRVDLEVNDKGSAQVINNVGGQLKGLGAEGIKAGAAIGTGFVLAQKAIEVTIGVLQSMGSAIAGAVSGFVALGGHLADVAAKTAISTQALQKLAFAGSLVGVSEDEITGAAVKMERALANGDAVFGKLGLSIQKLRAMKPDEAFAAIATQIMKIKDPAGQAAAAMEAFGKSGATLLPLMKSDIAAATAEAERLGIVLSDKDVAAADALGDAGTKLGAAWEGVKNQFAAAILQNPAVLQGLEALVRAMGDLSQWLIKNRGAIAALVDVLIGGAQSAVSGFRQLAEWIGTAGSKLKYFVDLVPGLREALKLVKDLNTYLGMKNLQGSGLTSSSRLVQPPSPPLNFTGGKADDSAAKKEEAIQKMLYDSRIRALREIDRQVQQEYKANIVVISQLLDEWARDEKETAAAIKASRDQLKQNGEAFMASWEAQLAREHAALMAQLDDIQGLGEALMGLGDALGSSFIANIGEAVSGWAAFAKGAANATTLTQKLTLAIDAASSAYKSGFESKSTGKGALQGAAKGAGAGAAFGPYGVVIGAIAGAAIGFFGAKKGQQAEIKALTSDFNDLVAQAKRAGITLTQAFDTKSAKGLKQAIKDINKTLADTAEAHEKLNDAAQRYGFTIDELGPKFAAQQLDPQMAQIYEDWQLLTAAGVDHQAMLERIGPEVGKLVDQYVLGGAEIPKAMKPIIDDLYTHGKLLHENGEAYTEAEYNGLSYASTMSQMFEELITKVNDLISALLGINPKPIIIPIRADDPDGLLHGGHGGNGDEGDRPIPEHASGLLISSLSRDRTLRVHRGERVEVTPAANSAARNAQDQGGTTINVNVNVEGDGDAQKIRDIVQRSLRAGFITVPKVSA